MKYKHLLDVMLERKFVVVELKSGAVVENGFIYEFSGVNWQSAVPKDDFEAFDTVIDKFLAQKPEKHLLIRLHGPMIDVQGVKVGTRDFTAGVAYGRGARSVWTVLGKEIHLK